MRIFGRSIRSERSRTKLHTSLLPLLLLLLSGLVRERAGRSPANGHDQPAVGAVALSGASFANKVGNGHSPSGASSKVQPAKALAGKELWIAQLPNGAGEPTSAALTAKLALEGVSGPSDKEAAAMLGRAVALIEMGQLPLAEGLCAEIITAYPGSYQAYQALTIGGSLRVRQGDVAGAFAPFEAVIAAHPGSEGEAMARYARGLLYEVAVGDMEKAAECYEEVNRLYPGTTAQGFALSGLAGLAERKGDAAGGRDLYLRSVAAAPGARSAMVIGSLFWLKRDYEGAIIALENHCANTAYLQSENLAPYFLSLSYGGIGRWPEAIRWMNQALRSAVNTEEAAWCLYQLALAQKTSGNLAGAKATVESLIAGYPDELPGIRAKQLLEEWQ